MKIEGLILAAHASSSDSEDDLLVNWEDNEVQTEALSDSYLASQASVRSR